MSESTEQPLSPEEARRLLTEAPEQGSGSGQPIGPRLKSAAMIETREVRWLWPNHIALGKFTVVAGDPGQQVSRREPRDGAAEPDRAGDHPQRGHADVELRGDRLEEREVQGGERKGVERDEREQPSDGECDRPGEGHVVGTPPFEDVDAELDHEEDTEDSEQ